MRGTLASLLFLAAPLAAQGAPGTDIYIMSLERSAGAFKVGPAKNVTARPGYDNQPAFSADGGSLYYTSQRSGQTDIYRYEIASGTTVQVTNTPESEYSPTVMPDGKQFSVIRVERDSTQRLWAFSLAGAAVKPVLDSIKPVGYHAWLNPDTVFVFVLGRPATLREAELAHGSARVLASNIGRTIARIPGTHQMSYIQQDSTGGSVRAVDPVTGTSETLVRLPEGAEFFTWMPDGTLLTASGNRLLGWKRGDPAWSELASFGDPGLRKLSRLAVSPVGDRIALVSEEPPTTKAP